MSKVVQLEPGRPQTADRCTRLQSARRQLPSPPVDAEVKDFLARGAIPILVRSWLEGNGGQKQIAETDEDVASCEPMAETPDVEAAR